MNRLQAIVILLWRFASAMLLSAWTTSVTILIASNAPRRGFARLGYADLSQPGVILLAAMVTLTPGTSTVDIDIERRELLLHVLDSEDIETTLSEIAQKFLFPIRVLIGGQS
ncbi:MAG: Na+/H+ antiporter subunit E [Pseudomonadota bacterium]|nr:MAG: Na+/H+ antiporter subunit E [Pseudomonadota bacterium]